MRFYDRISAFLFPPKCVGCGELIDLGKASHRIPMLCPDCTRIWNSERMEPCPCCSTFISDCKHLPKSLCRRGYIAHIKLARYDKSNDNHISDKLIFRMKEQPEARIYEHIADLLTVKLCSCLLDLKILPSELVFLYVPRRLYAKRKYGTDQAYELARKMANACDAVCPKGLIKRHIVSREQKKLNYGKRLENIQSILYLNKKSAETLCGKIVVVVDDIVTTGASVSAVADLALQAGAAGIIIVSVAVVAK